MNGSSPQINSRDWWNRYFAEHWDARGGSSQTRHFTQRLLDSLPPRELAWLRVKPRTILDWGCAFGEGVKVIADSFPSSSVTGLDFAETAIAQARGRYPEHRFVLSEQGDIRGAFDCIVTSNCLEHFESPLSVAAVHLKSCRYLYIALVPFDESPLHESHRSRLREEDFPASLSGFTQLHVGRIDVDRALWNGQQLLVVYASTAYLEEQQLPLASDRERQKWQRYHETLPSMREGEDLLALSAELVDCVSDLLPAGGRILDAGSGAGWHSLALARTGKFSVTLMDFVPEALAVARRRFDQAGVAGAFVVDDVRVTGNSDFDLVLCAGLLEHYSADGQLALLKGMRSRSRNLVFTVVPNAQSYWYWLWRLHEGARGKLPLGSETPQASLAQSFQTAGLGFVGQDYLGAQWTESLLASIDGIDANLREELLLAHRSSLIGPEQKCHFIAAVGSVSTKVVPAARFARSAAQSDARTLELHAALADALAARVAAEAQLARNESALREANADLRNSTAIVKARDEAIAWLGSREKARAALIERLHAEINAARTRIAQLDSSLDTRQRELDGLVAERASATAETAAQTSEREARIRTLTARAELLARELEAAHARGAELLSERNGELSALRASLSWRMTRPFRLVGEKLPRLEWLARVGAKLVWFTITLQLPAAILRTIRRRRDRETISSSGGFDAAWYLAQYPDVRFSGIHPLVHYVAYGPAEGRNPNRAFDTAWYLQQNADLCPTILHPFAHYLKYGAAEGRNPGPQFDGDWYLATNPDVRKAGYNPVVHYVQYGAAEGRATAPQQRPAPSAPSTCGAQEEARSKYDVVILANIDWKARWQRPQQLATQFARNGHRVFYVVAFPNFADGGARRYEAQRVADGISQVRFPQACFFDRYADVIAADALARTLKGFDDLVRDFDMADAMIHVHLPSWAPLALALREAFLWTVIYDCMDEWDSFPNIGSKVRAAELDLVRAADGVSVTGPLLMEKWRRSARRCELVRNGVDFAFFRDNCRENDRFSFASPVVGYYGAIAEWLDLDLLADLAARNRNWQFVLAGDVFVSDLRGLDRMPNVTMLGLRPHADMPALLWHFDVCLIPFRVNDMTHAVDPVKLYEYLSGGKPVVSVPLKEVEIHRDVITLATGSDQFTREIAAAVADRDVARAERRRALAMNNQWSDRFSRADALVRECFALISIVIVTHNNSHLTRLCVDSILANTTHPSFEIIIVDNESSDDTAEYLRQLERQHANVIIILNSENRGFATANNQALAVARGEILILLNNDVVVPRGWLRGLKRCLVDPAVGLVGPVTNSVGNEARIRVSYARLDDMHSFARAHMAAHRAVSFDIAVLAMYCMAMRRDAFERIGPLDEGFAVGMFEDDDYANRARQAGYRVVCTEESFVHHAGQASFKKLISTGEYQAIWERNLAYYESKWGKWTPHVHRAT
jgi:GT2 family glycosyltransferase/2-polyprenyl-3-methyl-5-hydroxy-6-metoxy-1,4-benzoquinol methylase/glycosyltransferase involved in cell wall biosynthesis